MNFTNEGYEVLSQIPLAIPYDKTRPESLNEQIARMVQTALSQEASAHGEETFEEANDFGDEDPEIASDAPLSMFQEETFSGDPKTYNTKEGSKNADPAAVAGLSMDGKPDPEPQDNQPSLHD